MNAECRTEERERGEERERERESAQGVGRTKQEHERGVKQGWRSLEIDEQERRAVVLSVSGSGQREQERRVVLVLCVSSRRGRAVVLNISGFSRRSLFFPGQTLAGRNRFFFWDGGSI